MDTQLNIHEIDGRILELIRQRNEALDKCVLLSGQLAILREELKNKPIVMAPIEEK